MVSNLDRYKKDLEGLITLGNSLLLSMHNEVNPQRLKEAFKGNYEKNTSDLPDFSSKYQAWYSESLALIKLLLPDRLTDFVKLYEKPKTRKNIRFGNYVIEDYLQGLRITSQYSKETIVDRDAAIPQFEIQLNILKSAERRFASTLFEIKQLVQADLFDSELDAANELNKNGFHRGAGAIAGVVLEKHLEQAVVNHSIVVRKNNPSINDYNQLLKDNNVLDISAWRFIQHLADIRNLCDHNKNVEPSKEQVSELIAGVVKITKSVY